MQGVSRGSVVEIQIGMDVVMAHPELPWFRGQKNAAMGAQNPPGSAFYGDAAGQSVASRRYTRRADHRPRNWRTSRCTTRLWAAATGTERSTLKVSEAMADRCEESLIDHTLPGSRGRARMWCSAARSVCVAVGNSTFRRTSHEGTGYRGDKMPPMVFI
jgi:hypothetical protein